MAKIYSATVGGKEIEVEADDNTPDEVGYQLLNEEINKSEPKKPSVNPNPSFLEGAINTSVGYTAGGYFDSVAKFYHVIGLEGWSEDNKKKADAWKEYAAKGGASEDAIASMIYQGLGSIPLEIPKWAGKANPYTLGAQAGYMALEGYREDGTLTKAFTNVVERLGLGKIFGALEKAPISQLQKVAVGSGTLGTQGFVSTLSQTGDLNKASKAGVAGAGTGAILFSLGSNSKSEAIKMRLIKEGLSVEKAQELADISANVDLGKMPKEDFNSLIEKELKTTEAEKAAKTIKTEIDIEVLKESFNKTRPIYDIKAEELVDLVNNLAEETSGVKPTKESVFNMAKFQTPEAQKTIIEKASALIADKAYPGVESLVDLKTKVDKTVKDFEEETGLRLPLDEMRGTVKELRVLNEKVILYRKFLTTYTDTIKGLLDKAQSPGATTLDKFQLFYHLTRYGEVEGLVKETSVESSRLLGSWRAEISSEGIPIEDLSLDFLKQNPDLNAKLESLVSDSNLDIAKLAKDFSDRTSLEGKLKALKKHSQGNVFTNVALEARRNNLLSSIWTGAKDVTGNSLNLVFENGVNFISAGLTKGLKLKGGMTFNEASMFLSGSLAGMKQNFLGLKKATGDAVGYFSKTHSIRDFVHKVLDVSEAAESYVDKAGVSNNITSRAVREGMNVKAISKAYLEDTAFFKTTENFLNTLGAAIKVDDTLSDIMWKTINIYGAISRISGYTKMKLSDMAFETSHYYGKVYETAYRRINEHVKAGQDGKPFVENLIRSVLRFKDEKVLPEDAKLARLVKQIHEEASKFAETETFKGELQGKFAKKTEQIMNQTGVGTTLKLLVNAFYSTPLRLFIKGQSYDPLLFMLSRDAKNQFWGEEATPRTRGKQAAKLLVGSMLYLTAAELISQGQLTGLFDDKNKKAANASGLQESSLKFGDNKLMSLVGFDPYSSFITGTSSLVSAYYNGGGDDKFLAMAKAYSKDRISRQYLKGLQDIVQVLSEDGSGKKLKQYGNSLAGSFVPLSGFMRSARGLAGQNVNLEIDNMWDAVKSSYTPEDLRPRLDGLGKELKQPNRNIFGGTVTKIRTDSPARLELARHGIDLNEIGKSFWDVDSLYREIKPKQRWEIEKLVETKFNLEDQLNAFVDTPDYKDIPTVAQKEILQSLVSAAYKGAKALYFGESGEAESLVDKGEALIELYQIKNSGDPKAGVDLFDFQYSSSIQKERIRKKYNLKKKN